MTDGRGMSDSSIDMSMLATIAMGTPVGPARKPINSPAGYPGVSCLGVRSRQVGAPFCDESYCTKAAAAAAVSWQSL